MSEHHVTNIAFSDISKHTNKNIHTQSVFIDSPGTKLCNRWNWKNL